MGEHLRFAFRILAITSTIVCIGAGHCVGIGMAAAADAETTPVIVAVAQDLYPEYSLNADGRPVGFAVDMMNAVAKRAGLNITYRVMEGWPDVITTLEQGAADVIPIVAMTSARKQRMLFTRPLVTSPISVFVREDADSRGWTDLNGRRVAVISGGFSAEFLGENYPRTRLLPYAQLKHALFDLLSGEVDALVSFDAAVWKVADHARVADRIKVLGGPIAESQRAIAVRQDLPGLRDRLDDVVAGFIKSPDYAQLYAKWYAASPSFWTTERIGWLAGVSTAFFLLGMLIWQALSLHAETPRSAAGVAAPVVRARAKGLWVGQKLPQLCGLVALVLGSAILLGWTLQLPILKSGLPGAFAMQPWAAVSTVIAGAALLFATRTWRPAVILTYVLAGAVLIIGLQILLQQLSGAESGNDRWLFPGTVGNQTGLSSPTRLAPVTAFAFIALGGMLLLVGAERRWLRAIYAALGALGLLLIATILVGYLFGGGRLQSVAFVTPIAVHTAMILGILFIGALTLRPDVGWMAVLCGDRPGAVWARMLLPVTIVGPLLLAWLFAVGAAAGLYEPEFQVGLSALATMALLVTSLLWSGVRVDRLDQAREIGLAALRRSEARLRHFIDAAPVAMAMFDSEMRYVAVSERFITDYRLHGRELIGRSYYELFPDVPVHWRVAQQRCLQFAETKRSAGEPFVHANGQVDWVRWEIQPWFDAGDKVGGIVLFSEDITERKHAEDALRESEARLRRTVEHAPFPIMVHAEDGTVVYLSRSWLQLTGYDRADIGTIADWTERAYREPDRTAIRAEIDRLYALEAPLDEGEHAIRTADGRRRVWVLSSAPLGRDSHGQRLVVSMASDVTARKEAERALGATENRVRALLDASADEILLIGIEGNVLAINKAAERRLAKRTTVANLIDSRLHELLPRDQAESRLATVGEVAATRIAQHCEVQAHARWFEFWYYPVIQSDKPVTEVAIYAREITAQKKWLTDLSKFFQAVDQSPMSVVITDCNGNIEYVNPEFTKVTGYTSEEAIGQNPRILKSGHTSPEAYAELWRILSTGGVWRGEFLNRKKNGELYWELASIAAVKIEEKITHFVAVKEDITIRREMEEQLRHSQKMQAVGQLSGGIAHDFNNLLAIVIGNLQLLREKVGSDDTKVRDYLDDALWSARRGGELTHRLLAFARKQPLKPAVIDINNVVHGMSELLRRTLGARIRIDISLAPDLWQAVADRGELERAIVNLAVNARDAMPTGGLLNLETRNTRLDEDYCGQCEEVLAGEYVMLGVTDSGIGMSPDIIERVFEPFFTTKEIGHGSGLGLSMVYGFVKQSGGHISIYSRVGHGTSVKLYLPRGPASAQDRKEATAEEPAGEFGDSVVLVVEDEPKLRKVAVMMLERLGLRSMQAENAKDALALMASSRPDVLFTDIELPGGMNGIDLADAVNALDPTIKVLFTTGYTHEATLHARWLKDKIPWLLKPYSHLDLARELRALLPPAVH